jgi:hypothetical protein
MDFSPAAVSAGRLILTFLFGCIASIKTPKEFWVWLVQVPQGKKKYNF